MTELKVPLNRVVRVSLPVLSAQLRDRRVTDVKVTSSHLIIKYEREIVMDRCG